MIRSARSLFGS